MVEHRPQLVLRYRLKKWANPWWWSPQTGIWVGFQVVGWDGLTVAKKKQLVGLPEIFIIEFGDITKVSIPGGGKRWMNMEIVDREHLLLMGIVEQCGFLNLMLQD